jgi:hypothetical protein
MKPATLLSLVCLVTACWMGSVSDAAACTCSGGETIAVRDASAAVFEGMVVDQRLVLLTEGPIWVAYPEQVIVVGRVWKGVTTRRVTVLYKNQGMCSGHVPVGLPALFFLRRERGSLVYALCSHNQGIVHGSTALAKLGPPIATFARRLPVAGTMPMTMPLSRRLRAFAAVATAYYLNMPLMMVFRFEPPFAWHYGVLMGVVLIQLALTIRFLSKRLPRHGFLLFASSFATLVVMVLWTGYHLLNHRYMDSSLLSWS